MSDTNSGRRFLVDTGAQASVIPASWTDRRSGSSDQQLQAVNGTSIVTYDVRNVILCLCSHRFTARLVIADVKRSLLCADFLRQHNLQVDISGQQLIESDTYLSVSCDVTRASAIHLSVIDDTVGPPVHARARRLYLKVYFHKMENKGIICKSSSPWASPPIYGS